MAENSNDGCGCWTMIEAIVLIGIIVSCLGTCFGGDDDKDKSTAKTEQVSSNSTTTESSTVDETPKNPFIGKWSFTDKGGQKFTINIKEGKTAELVCGSITIGEGEDQVSTPSETLYCSWDTDYDYEHITIWTSDKNPKIAFPNALVTTDVMYIKDGYVYQDRSTMEAKNPNGRLKITKH